MIIKIDCALLDEQMKLLDAYASIITNKHYKELVDGVINLLDQISWAVEENEEISIVRYEE